MADDKLERSRAKARARYYANRPKRLRQMKEYRERNKDSLAEYHKNWASTMEGKARKLVRMAAYRAKKAGVEYDLDWEWLHKKLVAGRCEVTGIELQESGPWGPSIDRIEAGAGYTKENSRVVCYMMNVAKNSFTDDDVELFCKAFLEARCRKK